MHIIANNISNIEIRGILSSGSRVFACGRTDGRKNRQTDRRNEANSPLFVIFLKLLTTKFKLSQGHRVGRLSRSSCQCIMNELNLLISNYIINYCYYYSSVIMFNHYIILMELTIKFTYKIHILCVNIF